MTDHGPTDIDAEAALLGGMLVDPSTIDEVLEGDLRGPDFSVGQYRVVFLTLVEMHERGDPVDTITVTAELARRERLADAGGAAELSRLEAMVPTAAHVPMYSRLVREKAQMRALIAACAKISTAAGSMRKPVSEILDDAERAVTAAGRGGGVRRLPEMRELMTQAIEDLEKAYRDKRAVTGVASGLRDLDDMTSGWQPGELVIIAARPSMGKSALALTAAEHAATHGAPCLFFSLEMSEGSLAQRALGSRAGVDLQALRRGFVQAADWTKLAKATGELSEAQLLIDDTPGHSLASIRSATRRAVSQRGVSLVFVDYLQLVSRPEGNTTEALGRITKGLKQLARELDITVVALSQLNRGVESRNDKRPMMSDLRASGEIEEDADLIGFLYREEYYLKDKTPDDKIGVAEFIIAKHRNGPIGTVELSFRASTTRFSDHEQRSEYV